MPFVLFLLLLGLQVASGRETTCPLPAQRPMIVARLFFGRDVAGRAPVSDAEWAGFVAEVVSRQFPDGFTVEDGEGEWYDRTVGRIVSERTKILTVAVKASTGTGHRLQVVEDAYKRQFHQSSVGVITGEACGAF